MPDLIDITASFGHLLHREGVAITPERSSRFTQAISLASPTSLDELYWIGYATLISNQADARIYGQVFTTVFRGVLDMSLPTQEDRPATASEPEPAGDTHGGDSNREVTSSPNATTQTPGSPGDSDETDQSVLAAVAVQERLNERDFSALTPAEYSYIAELIDQLKFDPPLRSRRRKVNHRRGREINVRATLRQAHRNAGDPIRLVRRKNSLRPRRVVLLADVSGSMEPYARAYLHLARGSVSGIRAESFVFATRLTRLTKLLREVRVDTAYSRVAQEATDWSGGTRIGAALQEFIDRYGRRGMARGAIIVIVSDGWELDDPAGIARAMKQLSLLAHKVIWVNPRKAASGYQPLVGGMAAAMPFVDTFLSGHSLSAMKTVIAAIGHHDG